MSIVRFRHYRDYDAQRVLANNSMMGLLAGSQLASQTLRLTAGSSAHLSEIFTTVPHIGRFNLRVDQATDVLNGAEGYLAAICIPYVMAAHEAFMKEAVLGLCVEASKLSKTKASAASMENLHETLEGVGPGLQFTADTLALFHVLRAIRNVIIHSNGQIIEPRHLAQINAPDTSTVALWTRLTREPFPSYTLGDTLNPSLSMLIATLAVSKRLAEEANVMLQSILDSKDWKRVADDDWASNGLHVGNPDQLERRRKGFIRQHYSAVLKSQK